MLAGGGARAAYEVGVLSAIAERVPDIEFPIVTGVSAGAINAMALAAHEGTLRAATDALRARWTGLSVDRVYRVQPLQLSGALLRELAHAAFGARSHTTTVRGLLDMIPLRKLLQGSVDFGRIETKIAGGRLHAAALSAMSYATGQSVTFIHAPPDVPTWHRAQRYALRVRLTLDHLMASVALPILFPAVRIGDTYYGDGSVGQTAPLAPAIHLGARAILVVTQRSAPAGPASALPPPRDYPTLAEIIGRLLHAVFLDSLEADVERIDRVNTLLSSRAGGDPAPGGLRPVAVLMLRPSRDLAELAVGRGVRLPPAIRWIVRAMGGQHAAAVDFLSYLLFDASYTSQLVELGYADARAGWERIERFLTATER